MRTSFRLGIFAAVLLAPSIAAADDSGWYLGLDLGRANATALPGDSEFFPGPGTPSVDPGLTINSSYSLSSTSSNVEGGYWFNTNVGLQAGLLDLGTFSGSVHMHDSGSKICINGVCGLDSSDTRQVKARGVTVAVTSRLPLSDEFELLGRAGIFSSHTTFDEEQTSNFVPVNDAHLSKDNFASDFGVGLGWKFTSHWEAQLRWDQYAHLGGGNFGTFNARVSSLAVQYHF